MYPVGHVEPLPKLRFVFMINASWLGQLKVKLSSMRGSASTRVRHEALFAEQESGKSGTRTFP